MEEARESLDAVEREVMEATTNPHPAC